MKIEYTPDDPTPIDSRWDYRFQVPQAILDSGTLSELTERLTSYLYESGFRLDGGAPDVSFGLIDGAVWAFVNVDDGTDPTQVIEGIGNLPETAPENDIRGMRNRLVSFALKAENSTLNPGKTGPKPTPDETQIAVRDLIRLLERTFPVLSG
jgi:hypothetical protein